jgi:hypothetical protein
LSHLCLIENKEKSEETYQEDCLLHHFHAYKLFKD